MLSTFNLNCVNVRTEVFTSYLLAVIYISKIWSNIKLIKTKALFFFSFYRVKKHERIKYVVKTYFWQLIRNHVP